MAATRNLPYISLLLTTTRQTQGKPEINISSIVFHKGYSNRQSYITVQLHS